MSDEKIRVDQLFPQETKTSNVLFGVVLGVFLATLLFGAFLAGTEPTLVVDP